MEFDKVAGMRKWIKKQLNASTLIEQVVALVLIVSIVTIFTFSLIQIYSYSVHKSHYAKYKNLKQTEYAASISPK